MRPLQNERAVEAFDAPIDVALHLRHTRFSHRPLVLS
jgi:hypothetical protein